MTALVEKAYGRCYQSMYVSSKPLHGIKSFCVNSKVCVKVIGKKE